LDILKISMKKV